MSHLKFTIPASLLLTSSLLLLTGCGLGFPSASVDSSSAPVQAPLLKGSLHGGPNPVVGAVITIYATQNNGYGGNGLELASTTTDALGGFAFDRTSYVCPAGQQAYVTAVGGNTGANAANPNAFLVAAVGKCENLTASTFIYINELSTVAAAFAIGNFMSINGNTLNISAPANNNKATGVCTGTGYGSGGMTCVAAGLPHAFQNAINIVNSIGTVTALPTGMANTSFAVNPGSTAAIPGLTTGTNPFTLQNSLPTPLINTLGNILQSCVNSIGGSAGDGSACGTLFTNTTPPSSLITTPVAPTNTLQATMNIAKYPYNNAAALYALSPATAFYQPTLSGAPSDFSIAIVFHSTNVAGTPTTVRLPWFTALDANDNVFTSTPGLGTDPGQATYATPNYAQSMDYLGNSAYQTALTGSSACSSGANNNLCMAALDNLGNFYIADKSALYQVPAGGAATNLTLALTNPTSTLSPYSIAVDRYNDVFVSQVSSSTDLLAYYTAGPSSTTAANYFTYGATPTKYTNATYGSGAILFDGSGDLGIANLNHTPQTTDFFANTGTTSIAFGGGPVQNATTSTAEAQQESVIFDNSGNLISSSSTVVTVAPVTDTNSANPGSGETQITYASSPSVRMGAIDGDGTVFFPDAATGTQYAHVFYPAHPTVNAFIRPCYPWGSPTTTTATSGNTATTSTPATVCQTHLYRNATDQLAYAIWGARNLAIDSAGDIWIGAQNAFAITEVLGIAAPSWPLASYAGWKQRPQ